MHSNYSEDLLEHRSANTYAKDGKGAVIPSQVEMQVFIRKRTYNADNFTGYFNYELETGRLKHKLLLGYDYAQQELMPGGSQLQAEVTEMLPTLAPLIPITLHSQAGIYWMLVVILFPMFLILI
jgi:ABC-type uncharacterized transport system permease subunit